MRRLLDCFGADPLALDEGSAERLLTGSLDPDDAPPGYAGVTELLRAAGGPAQPHELSGEAELVSALAAAMRQPSRARPVGRFPVFEKSLSVKVAVAAGTAVLGLTGALASAGALPGPAQSFTASVLHHVGVSVPPAGDPASGSAPTASAPSSSTSTSTTTPGPAAKPVTLLPLHGLPPLPGIPGLSPVGGGSVTPAPTGPAAPSPTPAPPAAVGAVTTRYPVGTAGTVTVSQSGDTLQVVAVDSSPGWSYKIDKAGPDHDVQVHFTAPSGGDGQFHAELHDGQIHVDVHSNSNTPVAPPAPGPTTQYAVGTAGAVTVSQSGDTLQVVAVDPGPGWSYKTDKAGPDHDVQVHFTAASGGDGEFHAQIDKGQTRAEVHSNSQSPAAPPSAGPTTTQYTVGTAGTVTVSQSGDTLQVVAVDPSPGWSCKIDKAGPDHDVQVHFTAASGGDGELHAEIHNGQIHVDLHGTSQG